VCGIAGNGGRKGVGWRWAVVADGGGCSQAGRQEGKPPSALKSHRKERENPWADWERMRQQVARQEVPQSQGRTPPPANTDLQPALFEF
jgi:hypothetical protein